MKGKISSITAFLGALALQVAVVWQDAGTPLASKLAATFVAALALAITAAKLPSCLFLLACLACTGCPPTPVPVPPPGPSPIVVSDAAQPAVDAYTPAADAAATNPAFTGKVFDCQTATVIKQRAQATAVVSACLLAPPANCLAGLIGNYDVNTVACVARDLGASAQMVTRAGTGTADDRVRAANVRNWVLAEKLGYR